MTSQNETMKFWTFLTMLLLAVAVTVTLIDLTIKASILAESNALKLAMEDWEVRNGQKVSGRIDERDPAYDLDNVHLSSDVLATGDARMEAGSSHNGDKAPSPKRARNGRFTSPSDGN